MHKALMGLAVVLCFFVWSQPSQATTVDVYAMEHSSSIGEGPGPHPRGSGLDTGIDVTAGEKLWITATGCWSAAIADPSRTSDANGLIPSFSNPCTSVAWTSGQWTQGGLTANFGSLVGSIDGGDFFLIGTDFYKTIEHTGRLFLYYFDSDNFNNEGSVQVTILFNDPNNSLSEPALLFLMGTGLAGLGFVSRKRKS